MAIGRLFKGQAPEPSITRCHPASARGESRVASRYFSHMVDVRRLLHDLLVTAPLGPDDVGPGLWNADVRPGDYNANNEPYFSAILEQYKIYVEMADRISARRALANTFFLTLNTAILTAIGVLWDKQPSGSNWALLVPLIVLLSQCLTWFWLIRSYRQLNTVKYAVIAGLERRLPATPYWGGEWLTLREGRDRTRYWPLTHLEQGIPMIFALAYLGGFVLLVV